MFVNRCEKVWETRAHLVSIEKRLRKAKGGDWSATVNNSQIDIRHSKQSTNKTHIIYVSNWMLFSSFRFVSINSSSLHNSTFLSMYVQFCTHCFCFPLSAYILDCDEMFFANYFARATKPTLRSDNNVSTERMATWLGIHAEKAGLFIMK